MRRGINKDETYRLIEKIRKEIPDIALRTTLLVGHPGETQKAFDELKQFVGDIRFERLGVFPYSEEEGTYSAAHFQDTVSNKKKMERVNEIMAIQNKISEEMNAAKKGQYMKVIIDRTENDFVIGRSEHDSPEIDQEVLISKTGTAFTPGDFVTVKIIDNDDYDLYAEIYQP
jgi:ribosomal protein S12 methylthiotransferase